MSNLPGVRASGNSLPEDPVDVREQLYNDGATGPIHHVQRPGERVTLLLGIMLDMDPARLAAENQWFPPADDPRQFLDNIRPALRRHPLARHAEVRSSGTGLHLIVRLDPPVELATAAAQKRWADIVRAVQWSLPSDPNAPGITALTRPVGSINSKNGATVEVLDPGRPVEPGQVIDFMEELVKAPFKTVASILLGSEHVRPCPVCRTDGSQLNVLDRVGRCYARCGKVGLAQVYDAIYRPVEPAREQGGREPAGDRDGAARRPAQPREVDR